MPIFMITSNSPHRMVLAGHRVLSCCAAANVVAHWFLSQNVFTSLPQVSATVSVSSSGLFESSRVPLGPAMHADVRIAKPTARPVPRGRIGVLLFNNQFNNHATLTRQIHASAGADSRAP